MHRCHFTPEYGELHTLSCNPADLPLLQLLSHRHRRCPSSPQFLFQDQPFILPCFMANGAGNTWRSTSSSALLATLMPSNLQLLMLPLSLPNMMTAADPYCSSAGLRIGQASSNMVLTVAQVACTDFVWTMQNSVCASRIRSKAPAACAARSPTTATTASGSTTKFLCMFLTQNLQQFTSLSALFTTFPSNSHTTCSAISAACGRHTDGWSWALLAAVRRGMLIPSAPARGTVSCAVASVGPCTRPDTYHRV